MGKVGACGGNGSSCVELKRKPGQTVSKLLGLPIR